MRVKLVDLMELAERLRFCAMDPENQPAQVDALQCMAGICEKHAPDGRAAAVHDLRFWADIFGRYAEMIEQLSKP